MAVIQLAQCIEDECERDEKKSTSSFSKREKMRRNFNRRNSRSNSASCIASSNNGGNLWQ